MKMLLVLPYALKTIYYARKSIKSVRKNPANPRRGVDEGFIKDLEALARELGVSAVGYTRVPRNYIFSNAALLYDNAVVLLMAMDKDRMKKAPGVWAGIEVFRTYARLSKAVYKISEFMRKRGYGAQPDPPIGRSTHFPLLAQKAGLGWIGKSGLLISEERGPSQRIAAVYTSAELPYTDDGGEKYSWIPQFCETCNRCVQKCPAKAIYPQPMEGPDGQRIYIDYKKCAVVFSRTLGCGVCIKECPFFKADFARIRKAYEALASRRVSQT